MGCLSKEFYHKGPFGRFARLENLGDLPDRLRRSIPALCRSLVGTGQALVEGIEELSWQHVHDLQLLTVGPYLRGSELNKIGQQATVDVFQLVKRIVAPAIRQETERTIRLENDSGRTVLVEFSSDPDVRITEKLPSGVRPQVSVEVKGGADASHIHNRLGEAEKSHQKARKPGFFEFWTLVRVDVNREEAQRDSPTTSRFFHLDRIQDPRDAQHEQFRDLLCSTIGIRGVRREEPHPQEATLSRLIAAACARGSALPLRPAPRLPIHDKDLGIPLPAGSRRHSRCWTSEPTFPTY